MSSPARRPRRRWSSTPACRPTKLADQVKGLTVRYIVANALSPRPRPGKDDLKELTGGQTSLHSADAKQFLRSPIAICWT